MNETLEATARAIFKSWFVDFDPVKAKMEGQKPVGMDTENRCAVSIYVSRFSAWEDSRRLEDWNTR